MNAWQTAVAVVLVTILLAGLTGIAAYMRSINGTVPTAIANGIEAGLKQLRHGPIMLGTIGVNDSTIPAVLAPSVIEGGGPLASTVRPWYPASYIPAWDQIAGPLPDGNPDPEQYNDCGETCVAMVVAGVHGVPVDPGGIRQWLHGVQGTGLTDGNDLVRALAHYSTAAHCEAVSGEAAWRAMVGVVATERPVIMLGRWASVGGAMHWMVAVKAHPDRVDYVNPWQGTRSYCLKSDWLQQYAGYLVVLDSHIHYDCRHWSQPT